MAIVAVTDKIHEWSKAKAVDISRVDGPQPAGWV